MSHQELVNFEELQSISGCETPADVRGWLIENEVVYFKGARNRPSTTIKSLNSALGLEVTNDDKFTVSVP